MADKNKAPQSEVGEDLAGRITEDAGKTHAHWFTQAAEKDIFLGHGIVFQGSVGARLTCYRENAT